MKSVHPSNAIASIATDVEAETPPPQQPLPQGRARRRSPRTNRRDRTTRVTFGSVTILAIQSSSPINTMRRHSSHGTTPCRRAGLQRTNSFDGEFGVVSPRNASRPARRGSIDITPKKEEAEEGTVKEKIQQVSQQNAHFPRRKGSIDDGNEEFSSDSSEKEEPSPKSSISCSANGTTPLRRLFVTSAMERAAQMPRENVLFRAELMSNVLDDMGLFDGDDPSTTPTESAYFAYKHCKDPLALPPPTLTRYEYHPHKSTKHQ